MGAMIKLIYFDNTVSAQIQQRSLFWLNVGFRHLGLVIPYTYIKNKCKKDETIAERILFSVFPLFMIGLNTCDFRYSRRWLAYVCICGFFFGIPLIDNKISPPVTQKALHEV
jgi:hypothetical protein